MGEERGRATSTCCVEMGRVSGGDEIGPSGLPGEATSVPGAWSGGAVEGRARGGKTGCVEKGDESGERRRRGRAFRASTGRSWNA